MLRVVYVENDASALGSEYTGSEQDLRAARKVFIGWVRQAY
jgi:hypothetical protein